MYGLGGDEAAARAGELLELTELDLQGRRAGGRVLQGHAAAAGHRRGAHPRARSWCFLDEPFEGIDVLAAGVIRELLRSCRRRGVTLLLTTHVLEIAERLATHAGVIQGGRMVDQGAVGELMRPPPAWAAWSEVFEKLIAVPAARNARLSFYGGGAGAGAAPAPGVRVSRRAARVPGFFCATCGCCGACACTSASTGARGRARRWRWPPSLLSSAPALCLGVFFYALLQLPPRGRDHRRGRASSSTCCASSPPRCGHLAAACPRAWTTTASCRATRAFPISPLPAAGGLHAGEPASSRARSSSTRPVMGAAVGYAPAHPPASPALAVAASSSLFALLNAAWSRVGLHLVLNVLREKRSAEMIGGFFVVLLVAASFIPPIDTSWLTAVGERRGRRSTRRHRRRGAGAGPGAAGLLRARAGGSSATGRRAAPRCDGAGPGAVHRARAARSPTGCCCASTARRAAAGRAAGRPAPGRTRSPARGAPFTTLLRARGAGLVAQPARAAAGVGALHARHPAQAAVGAGRSSSTCWAHGGCVADGRPVRCTARS